MEYCRVVVANVAAVIVANIVGGRLFVFRETEKRSSSSSGVLFSIALHLRAQLQPGCCRNASAQGGRVEQAARKKEPAQGRLGGFEGGWGLICVFVCVRLCVEPRSERDLHKKRAIGL